MKLIFQWIVVCFQKIFFSSFRENLLIHFNTKKYIWENWYKFVLMEFALATQQQFFFPENLFKFVCYTLLSTSNLEANFEMDQKFPPEKQVCFLKIKAFKIP